MGTTCCWNYMESTSYTLINKNTLESLACKNLVETKISGLNIMNIDNLYWEKSKNKWPTQL